MLRLLPPVFLDLAGRRQAGLQSRRPQRLKDLFGELKAPLAFTDGDTAEIEAVVSNDAVEAGDVTLTLATTIGDKTSTACTTTSSSLLRTWLASLQTHRVGLKSTRVSGTRTAYLQGHFACSRQWAF